VTKQASWTPTLSLSLEGGSFDHKRAVLDAGEALSERLAVRTSGVYEKSGGFRDAMTLSRYGFNPTVALLAGPGTMIRAGYELFDDQRRVDRGIPSFRGAPAPTSRTTFFGNPDVNRSTARVHIGTLAVEHAAGGWLVRNHTTWASYDKFYQNTFPGAVDATGTRVTLSAYNHAIDRRNLINVTDLSRTFTTGALQHTVLAGADIVHQRTNQARLTGYYNDSATSYSAPLATPTVSTPLSFRASATDADNHAIVNDASVYLQDQVALSQALLVVAGMRYEHFKIDYLNHRNGQELSRADRLVSPRVGLVLKPLTPLSLYASYGISYLPSSGDQFTALTVTTSTLAPERFTNREVGVKWDLLPDLSLTAAAYRLDRTNTTAPDPNDATRVVQTGAQRTTGWELGATGAPTRAWQIAAGFGAQRATIVSTTSAAKAGATVALVPHATASLWNRYQITNAIGMGLGLIHQTSMYAAVDNTVTLPGFTRADGAVYATLRRNLRAQVNIENLFDTHYVATSQGNNNIMPGAPRTVRVGLTASR
jgi:catecholate siderophore receptor